MEHLLILSGSVIEVVENHPKLAGPSEMKVCVTPQARNQDELK